MTKNLSKQIVVVLSGLLGSGKSTLAARFEKDGLFDKKWVVINQDILKSKKKCIKVANQSLDAGYSVIIDRTDMSLKQRSTWTEIARNWKISAVSIFLYPSALTDEKRKEFLIRRVVQRGVNHPTVKNTTEKGAKFLMRMVARDWSMPTLSEGFDALYTVESDDDMNSIGTVNGKIWPSSTSSSENCMEEKEKRSSASKSKK